MAGKGKLRGEGKKERKGGKEFTGSLRKSFEVATNAEAEVAGNRQDSLKLSGRGRVVKDVCVGIGNRIETHEG